MTASERMRAAQRDVLGMLESAERIWDAPDGESLPAHHARIRAAVARDALEILAFAWGLE